MSEIAVELRNISKQFSQRRASKSVAAVSQVNLQIRTGEFFTLLGPNGCGKTTSLRMIDGFEQPTSGEILIQGQPMTDVPPNRRPVNTVFQNYALFVRIAAQCGVTSAMSFNRFLEPYIQRIMEVYIGQYRRNYAIDTKENFEFERQISFCRSNSLIDMRRKG